MGIERSSAADAIPFHDADESFPPIKQKMVSKFNIRGEAEK
jgi:hypothetical protein